MKANGWMKRLPASALILILVSGCAVYAQDSKTSKSTPQTKNATVDDGLLKALEIALAKLASAEQVNSLQREQIDALQAKITALEGLVEVHKEIAATYKKAAEERATANSLDERRIALYESSLLDFRENTKRLIAERDSARRSRNTWAAVGFVLGAAATAYLKK